MKSMFEMTLGAVEGPKKNIPIYLPLIDVLVTCKHMVSKPVRCCIDTGAYMNVFPKEFATAFLGFSERSMKRDAHIIKILGVGGIETEGYGHRCVIHALDFCLKDVLIYFVDNQPFPLLGRSGFMDRFQKIIFDEKKHIVELIS